MTKETLEKEIKQATNLLLEMARKLSYNPISDNYIYILSEIGTIKVKNAFDFVKIRKRVNEKKLGKTLSEVINDLKNIYENLYDINLYIYKSLPKETIIEVQFYPKSSLEKDYFEKTT